MLTLIERWEQLSDDEVQSLKLSSPALPLQSVELLSPIPCPKRNLFCVARVSGEVRQDAFVRDMIFDIATAHRNHIGDYYSPIRRHHPTGTPPGVGIGFKPPKFLSAGDLLSLSIDPIGELHNRVV
jgi:hypothetical protein